MSKLHSHKLGVFGIQESGKTYWMKQKYREFKRPVVFSVNEDDGWVKLPNLYVYQANRTKLQAEFKHFIKWARQKALSGEIDLIIIDEADLFVRDNWDIDDNLQDLILNHRHMGTDKREGKRGVALWFATRRPQDIPTKIVESCKHLIIFKLEGANAVKRFSEIHPDIPELVNRLDFSRHNFVYKELGRPPVVHKPL